MTSFSQRIAKAAAESANAERRIAAAENKIARTLLEMLREDDEAENRPPPLPKQAQAERTKNPPKK